MNNKAIPYAIWLLATLLAAPAAADRCLEKCEAKRKETEQKLKDCLAQTKLMGRERAILIRKACLKKYRAPSCDGLPPCKKEVQKKHTPGLKLGRVIFSAARRGAPLKSASYRAGSEMFFRVEAVVTTKPKATGIWLQLDLSLLTRSLKGKKVVVVRWEKYLEQKKFLDADQRGTPKKYTLHGGAKLPLTFDPGKYEAHVVVKERVSNFSGEVSAPFSVTRAKAPKKKRKKRKRSRP